MKSYWKRSLSALLSAAMTLGYASPTLILANDEEDPGSLDFVKVENGQSPVMSEAVAIEEEDTEEALFEDDEVVRVSIILEDKSTLEMGYDTENIAENSQAMAYRAKLEAKQATVISRIEDQVLEDEDLDVEWNLTLAMNAVSANVKYGQIKDIEAVKGVKEVVLEQRYEPQEDESETADPDMSVSSGMIGSPTAYSAGYKGEGSRVAVIDTGTDTDHQSFAADAYEYALSVTAEEKGMTLDEYKATLDLLDVDEIAEVLDQLNAKSRMASLTADDLYLTSKLAYGFNYVDKNLTVNHDSDSQGEHGSHVAGIATSNAYISDGEGGYEDAIEAVRVAGVAPNAQLITMKVFGAGGGAYDSDYMAAIEDAIVLGCDSVNLSLGSGNPGLSTSTAYQDVLNSLTESGTTVVMSAGNSGYWAENSNTIGYLYNDDVSFDEVGSPGSFTNSLAVASVDNDGFTGEPFSVAGKNIYYTQSSYTNEPLSTIAGTYEYVFIDGYGTNEEWTALKDVLQGKVAICSRGSVSFYQKAEWAVANGAVATMIYNNTSGTINMDLSSYTKTNPCVALTQAEGDYIRSSSTPVTDEEGNVLYYTGTMEIKSGVSTEYYNNYYETMSSFSSWGVPGSLELKPEITAPGGNIYSVNGAIAGGTEYENMSGTSMAAPQVSGMAALVGQRVEEEGLEELTGESKRFLTQSLLMSTAVPAMEEATDNYWSVLNQGSGVGNVGAATTAQSYIKMDENATASYADGKVKAELGDDPDRTGVYSYGFSINNITDEATTYSMYTDLVTQDVFDYDGDLYLDTWTTTVPASVTYTVDGVAYVPTAHVLADVDGDKVTDLDDVQLILDLVTGKNDGSGLMMEHADVDGDGEITTKDARLVLESMATEEFEVAAGSSVDVTVEIVLSDDTKADLDADHPNGTYVEGYTFIQGTGNEEGVADVTHSIPILGYYGSWTEPSMYDHISYVEYLYEDWKMPYVASSAATNVLTYTKGSTGDTLYAIGNPYAVEDSFPEGKQAISTSDKLTKFALTPIRNAAGIATVITNQDGEVIWTSGVSNDLLGAYYYTNGSAWRNTSASLNVNKSVSSLGVKEGDTITVSAVAVPEYYEEYGTSITAEEIAELWSSGALGDGAAVSSTFVVDDTDPELLSISKDMMTGDITVTAKDNASIAYIGMYSKSGAKEYAAAVPEDNDAGAAVSVTFDLSEAKVGKNAMIKVCDYAGNETSYVFEYGGEDPDYTGKLLGFKQGSRYLGKANSWFTVDPDTFYNNYVNGETAGFELIGYADVTAVGADSVDGYIFYPASDLNFYTTEQVEPGTSISVGNLAAQGITKVYDAAWNETDGKYYILANTNEIWSVNLLNGSATYEYTANMGSTSYALRGLAISADGTWYAISGTGSTQYLATWTDEDIVDNAVTPTRMTSKACSYGTQSAPLTYDDKADVLYVAPRYNTTYDTDAKLWSIDPETGLGTICGPEDAGNYKGFFYDIVSALFVVESAGGDMFKETDTIEGVSLDQSEISALPGTTLKLTASVTPWNASNKTLTWSTSDDSVVTVENGTITTVAPGDAVVTATSNADSTKSASVDVHVDEVPSIDLSGFVYDTDGKVRFSEFNVKDTAGWTSVDVDMPEIAAGALMDGYVYTHGDNILYKIDADTLEIENLGTIVDDWCYTDAAEAPLTADGNFGKILGVCYNGQYLEMLSPEEGSLNYYNLASYFTYPFCAVAFIGQTTFNGNAANAYYIMNTAGQVYIFYFYGSSCSWGLVGETGLDLTGCETYNSGAHVSMTLDDETGGYLALTTYLEGNTASMYLIDTDSFIASEVGNFGEAVWPVVGLYQYDRPTDLTLRIKSAPSHLYEGQSASIEWKVVLDPDDMGVTFSSSNTSVATVDEDGKVTAVAEGEAVITVETKAVNSHGEKVSEDVALNVTGKTVLESPVSVDAYVNNGEPVWAEITVENGEVTTTTKAEAPEDLVSGGGNDGMALGLGSVYDSGNQSYLFDTTDYSYETGVKMGSTWVPYDASYVPTMSYETDAFTGDAFGQIAMLPYNLNFAFISDFAAGSVTRWSNVFTGNPGVAMAYAGRIDLGEDDGLEVDGPLFYVLRADGSIWWYVTVPSSETGLTMYRNVLVEDTGLTFEDETAVTMTFASVEGDEDHDHLIIADASSGETVLLFDLAIGAEDLNVGFIGEMTDATYVSSMHPATEDDEAEHVAVQANFNTAKANGSLVSETGEASTMEEIVSTVSNASEPNTATASAASMSKAVDTASKTTGSLNTVTVTDPEEPENPSSGVIIDRNNNTVTVKITAEDTANALAAVSYDASKLTYEGCASHASAVSANNVVDGDEGTVKVAFAEKEKVTRTVATLTFSYDQSIENGLSTTIGITVLEDGDELDLEESVEVPAIEIEYIDKEALKAAIAQANALVETDWTTTSWNNLLSVLRASQETLDNDYATQEETDNAAAALLAAIAGLQERASEAAIIALQKDVDAAKALLDQYDDDELVELIAALEAAQDILDHAADRTPAQCAEAAYNLSIAVQNLKKVYDKDTLRQMLQDNIDYIETEVLPNTEGVRPGKVQELKDALAAAKKVLANEEATNKELRDAIASLQKATSELWAIVSKTELNDLIEKAKAITSDGYTPSSYQKLQDAIAAGELVAANDDATTSEVSDAINAITQAIANLIKLDKSILAYEIELAQQILDNIDDYVPSTVEGLQDIVDEAKALMEDAKTQEEIDAMVAKVRAARLNARTLPDTAALVELLAEVGALKASDYTDVSYAVLQGAIDEAKAILANPEATQQEVDNAAAALKSAKEGLVLSSGTVVPAEPSDTEDPAEDEGVTMYRLYNPNSGEHFYTADAYEKSVLIKEGWKDEGTAWIAATESNTPVYRLYNPNAGDHHYTTDAHEVEVLKGEGWKDEGIGWYSDDNEGVKVYRLYNPNAVAGAHHFTTDKHEYEVLKDEGWSQEDVAWHGLAK